MLHLAVLLALATTASAQDTRSELARLASETGRERVDAERWLAINLKAQDLALVAEVAAKATIEVRTRLTRALGGDDRHFDLAVLLLTDHEPALHRLGHEVIAEMAVRWFGEGNLAPVTDTSDLLDALHGRFIGNFSVRPFEHDFDELIDMLARNAPTPLSGSQSPRIEGEGLPIVLDPLLYAEMQLKNSANNTTPVGGGEEVLSGNFETLLFDAVTKRGARINGFGFRGAHPWLRVSEQADVASDDALELIERWCIDVIQYPERPRGEGSARALAACGWSAPLAWLEKRWIAGEDRNALSGLLLAAGRGRVAPSLATEKAVESALRRWRDEPNGSGSFAWRREGRRLATAFARFSPVGVDGSDLSSAPGAAGFESTMPSYTSLVQAVIFGGMQRAPDAWRKQVVDQLKSARTRDDGGGALEWADESAYRLTYLRALASTQHLGNELKPWALAANASLLELVAHDRAEAQFLGFVQRVSATPPAEWNTPANVAKLGDAQRLLVIEWWLVSRDGLDNAARLALDWIATGKAPVKLGDMLAERVRIGDGARVERMLARAKELGAERADALERIALFAGVLAREPAEKIVKSMLANKPPRTEDLPLLGASAAQVSVETANALVDALIDAARRGSAESKDFGAPWADACERASNALFAHSATSPSDLSDASERPILGAPAVAQTFDSGEPERRLLWELRNMLHASGHPLARALDDATWPRIPGARPVSLEALKPWP